MKVKLDVPKYTGLKKWKQEGARAEKHHLVKESVDKKGKKTKKKGEWSYVLKHYGSLNKGFDEEITLATTEGNSFSKMASLNV